MRVNEYICYVCCSFRWFSEFDLNTKINTNENVGKSITFFAFRCCVVVLVMSLCCFLTLFISFNLIAVKSFFQLMARKTCNKYICNMKNVRTKIFSFISIKFCFPEFLLLLLFFRNHHQSNHEFHFSWISVTEVLQVFILMKNSCIHMSFN